MQHRQAADAGVEHADRPRARDRGARSLARRSASRRSRDLSCVAVHSQPSFQSATVGGSCARSWSPTCGPTPPTPSAGSSSATRSPRCGRLPGAQELEVELYEFPRAPARWPARAASCAAAHGGPLDAAAGRPARARFDVVHAHFGLTAWPALAVPARVRALTVHGTDVSHPRTRLATRAVLALIDLLAAVSELLAQELPARARAPSEVLPCGVDLDRFHPIPARAGARRARSRSRSPLPALPRRPGPRRRSATTGRSSSRGPPASGCSRSAASSPRACRCGINAADAVLVPSEREGFGLAVLEALACDVPVLATPVGIHPEALRRSRATLCAPFDLEIAGAPRSNPLLADAAIRDAHQRRALLRPRGRTRRHRLALPCTGGGIDWPTSARRDRHRKSPKPAGERPD